MGKERDEKRDEKLTCGNCGSGFGYYRIKHKEWVCRSCGFINKIKKEDKKDA